jgi:hypothetical protein
VPDQPTSPVPRRWDTSGRVKIERAKEHILDLDTTQKAFLDSNPHRIIIEPQKKTRRGPYSISIEYAPVPTRWSAIAADAIHNLRSALDILWRFAVHGDSQDARYAFFPFKAGVDEFKAGFGGEPQAPNVKKAVNLIKEIKPYPGGNDPLCHLHAMDLRDKHEVLGLVGIAFWYRTTIDEEVVRLSPVKDGTVKGTFDGAVPTEMHVKQQLLFEVAFAQGEILEGEPVLPVLHQFAGEVEGVAEAFLAAGLLP